ncbi:Protein flightless-1-like Protein [Tribolium castaneum]|uniref:Protein flightless-1-like Protein n=1 Tax=Tribolium castaneum TaxID=7070 RepID=D2A4H3_TRICA|nr:Protein flightless-1-like Protein [Tribolium castaneum]
MKHFMFAFFVFLFVRLMTSSVCNKEFEETFCENYTFYPNLTLNSAATHRVTIRNAKGSILPENFAKLFQVTELKISESQITSVTAGALCSLLPNLTSITISNNRQFPKITKEVFQGCQNIKRIILDDLQMENNALIDALELQALTLNNTIFPPRLEGLDSVKSLTVQHSNYTIIEKDLFIHLKSLKFLDLQYNKIRTIVPGSFEQLSQLKVLNLADNELDLTWNEFDGLKSLKVLFLERNKFTKVNVTKLVASLPNLERIFFSPDQLETKNRKEIEDIFPKLNITFIYGFSK